jgi:2'-deoxynucleoside 5'-phosphate N-hydrolase
MKIYFAGSVRAGREDAGIYYEIIEHLKKYGEVLTEHIGDPTLSVEDDRGLTDSWIHDRDMEWLLAADVLVAEVTTPSLGVGYEIGRAFENNIPVYCLYASQRVNRLSAMISGNHKLTLSAYGSPEELRTILDRWFASPEP